MKAEILVQQADDDADAEGYMRPSFDAVQTLLAIWPKVAARFTAPVAHCTSKNGIVVSEADEHTLTFGWSILDIEPSGDALIRTVDRTGRVSSERL